tara:strand:+ start:15356 stop:15508 length:153 start_codon:yes stop_codon:yes gene_type:complete
MVFYLIIINTTIEKIKENYRKENYRLVYVNKQPNISQSNLYNIFAIIKTY